MPKYQLPSGFIEYSLDEQVKFKYILRVIQDEYEHAGFTPIETASIQYSEVLLAKAGGEMDKEIYRFQKGSRDLSLRFDLTVPMARYIAEHHRDIPMPAKIYQIGKSWRAEKPQKGRYRELYQADIDILGNNSRLAEAETLSIIQNIFAILDLPQITFRISNRKILVGLLEEYQVQDQAGVLRVIDKYEKLSKENWLRAMQSLQITDIQIDALYSLISSKQSNEELLNLLQSLECQNVTFQEGIKELQELAQYLDLFQLSNYYTDLSIVRGQDYYTGTVFESNLEGLESFGSICSGGRYDNLVSNYIDTPITGFGASIGVSRLFGILREEDWFQAMNYAEDKRGAFILSNENLSENMSNIIKLRDEQGIVLDLYPEIVSFKKALQYANRKHYTEAIFFGSNEAKLGAVLVKNMQTGEQKIVVLQDIEM
ncbi:MAG: histidine--tRNA ligase, partial [Candidatus Paceibacterota bacterium]